MGHFDSFKQMPKEYYNHELGFYPKRILIIETVNTRFNMQLR